VDFDDTPAEAAFRKEVRTFLEAHATPKTGTDADWTRGAVADDPEVRAVYRERCRAWQCTLFDEGWAGLTWPREYGGRGGTPAESIIFNQEASQFDVTTGFVGAAVQLVGPPILRFGTEEQRRRYLPPLLRGDELWCQLFSEPGAGSDLASLATRAVRDGDEFVVNGQKVWTSEAQHADHGILLARTDPDVPKHKGITFFVVDMRTPGIDVRPLVQATGLSHFNEVFLSDVRIPAGNVVGEANGGWKVARTTMRSESSMISGAGQATTFVSVLATAQRCGRTDDPRIRQELARVWSNEQILRYLSMRAQTAVMTKRPELAVHGSLMKNFFTRSFAHRATLALHCEGAEGMLDAEAEGEGFWQYQCINQFASKIGGGTEEVHRNNLGEQALGLPREPAADLDRPWSELRKA